MIRALPRPARVIVITGGSSGIGRATAHRLAGSGDHLVLVARAPGPLADTAAECRQLGAASVQAVPVDVTDEQAVHELVDAVVDRHGWLDAWVHSAAVMAYGRFDETPSHAFRQVVEVELFGTVNAARAVLPVLRDQRAGQLLVIGSLLGHIVTPWMSPYVTSKWAMRGLVRTLAIENRDLPDVHIGLLSPGSVDTPLYRQAATFARRQGRPPPPVDSPERVARAVTRWLDHPARDRWVGRGNPLMIAGFTLTPAVFDRLVGPLMRVAGLSSEQVPVTAGNLFEPVPELNAVHGGFRRPRTRWRPVDPAAGPRATRRPSPRGSPR